MENEDLKFRFKGYCIINFETKDRLFSSDNNYEHRRILKFLEEKEKTINDKIRLEINNFFDGKVEALVSIKFSKGSIFWEGAVEILKAIDLIGGNIAVLIYLIKAIKFCIDKVVESNIKESFKPYDYSITEIVTNVEFLNYNLLIDVQGNAPVTFGRTVTDKVKELFSVRTILIVITLVNLIIFFGGNVYNFVSIESIQQRHETVMKIMDETKAKYANLVDSLKKDYDNYKVIRSTLISEIDTLAMLSKLARNNSDSLKLVNNENLNHLKNISKELELVKERNIKANEYGVLDLLKMSDRGSIILYFLILLTIILSFGLSLKALRKRN